VASIIRVTELVEADADLQEERILLVM